MPINWNADMDRKLFLAILKVHDISVDNKAVANELSTDDQPCTPMAVKKRLRKIKTQIKEGSGEGSNDGDEGTPKAKATPRKRASTAATGGESPTKKAKGKGEKAKKAVNENDDHEEGGAEAVIKEEAKDDDGNS